MQGVHDKAAIIVDFVLRRCTDAWTVHDYSSGGSDCIDYFVQLVEDDDNFEVPLAELGVDCVGGECEEVRVLVVEELNALAKQKRFDGEFELFNEFSRVLCMLQQVVDDVNRVFDVVSQELYRIYRECSGAEIRERIEVLMNRFRKIVGEVGSGSQHTGF